MAVATAAPHEARATHPVDTHVGRRIRMRRKALEVSQERLAHALGITFQQVQKYERGGNRISASKLYAAARFLKTTPGFFFEGLALDDGTDTESQAAAESLEPIMAMASQPHGVELARDFVRLPNTRYRRLLADLVASLAEPTVDPVMQ